MNKVMSPKTQQLYISPASLGFLKYFLQVLVAVMVILAVQSLWVNNFSILRIWDNAAIICVSATSLFQLNKHRVRLAVVVTLWGNWIIVCASIVLFNGLRNSATLSFPLFLMLTGWLLGRRQAVTMAGATAFLVFALAGLEHYKYVEFGGAASAWTIAGTMTAILALGVLISTTMANNIRAQYQELTEITQTLEQRVQERTAELSISIEKLKQTQLELVQREKMAALGSLVAGVAHELNTPIGNSLLTSTTLAYQTKVLISGLQTGLRRSELDSYADNALEATRILESNLAKAAELIGSFKQVAIDQTTETLREFSLPEMIGDIVLTLGPVIRKTRHQVAIEVPQDVRMQSYAGPLGQVLTNLINNALIHGWEDDSQGLIIVKAEIQKPGWVHLAVQDNGRGIAPENLARVFDPFFTTRLGQGGSGLGLNIVYNIVSQKLGGNIRVESSLGHGARFILELPLRAPQRSALKATDHEHTNPAELPLRSIQTRCSRELPASR
jgi:signal transduction histidine kinase